MVSEGPSIKQRTLGPFVRLILVILGGILLLVLLIWLGYSASWTGFNTHPAKTLWDWLQLLIVPAVLAGGAYLLNQATSRTDQRIAEQRYQNEQKIALDKQQEDLLQTYLDRMSDLLLEKDLRNSQANAEVRNVARVRTLTVLGQLDTKRQNAVLSFLREAKLVSTETGTCIISLSDADMKEINLSGVKFYDIDLSGADLRKANLNTANLNKANLNKANLSGANLSNASVRVANLSFADLSGVDLRNADLSFTNFSKADLSGSVLKGADLNGANLRGSYLCGTNLKGSYLVDASLKGANLTDADLSGANLKGVDLSGANLNRTNFSGANLEGSNIQLALNITKEQLDPAKIHHNQLS